MNPFIEGEDPCDEMNDALIRFVHTLNTPRKVDWAVGQLYGEMTPPTRRSEIVLEHRLVRRAIDEITNIYRRAFNVPGNFGLGQTSREHLAELAMRIGSLEHARLAECAIFHRDGEDIDVESNDVGYTVWEFLYVVANDVFNFYASLEASADETLALIADLEKEAK